MTSLSIRGTDLWHVDRGAGLPLLLVHGFPLDHGMWASQIDAFSPRCRVIAPDLRGFGRSPATDDAVAMDQFADDLAALLDALEVREPAVVCGLSMGGYIAFQFWRRHASRLRGLILCDTRAAADSPEAAAARFGMAERILREGPAPLESMATRLFAETTHRERPEVVESVRRTILAADPRGVAASLRGMAQRPDMTASLGRIRCPTLVLVGQCDALSPPTEMRAMAAAMPDSKFVEIPDAGHLAPLENPAAVNAAIDDFLARRIAQPPQAV